MSHRKKREKSRLRWRSVFLWHRYMGVCSALFVVMLAITGIMLNHTETLKLDSRHIQSSTLLDWYGIKPATAPHSYAVNEHWISEVDGQLYFNDQPLSTDATTLRGAVALETLLIAALPHQLLLLTLEGEIIEQMETVHGIPNGIQQIGINSEGLLILNTDHGRFSTDAELLEWQPYAADHGITWAQQQPPSPELLNTLLITHRGNGLTLERIVLDTHSGRILGLWGVYLMDAVAVIFIFLAAAGIWIWVKRKH